MASPAQRDPNGIRTRVTAVKGRCPGPLDDRVKAGQYRNCHQLAPGKLVAKLDWADMSPQSKWRLAFSVSVRTRKPIWLSAQFRLCVRSTLHTHFPLDAGATRCRGEARQWHARASRNR